MIPAQCRLWQQKKLTPADLDLANGFDRLRIYVDESHLRRGLYRCKDCGQLYFYEFYEQVDWAGGDDPQYRTLIPVTSAAEAEEMSLRQPFELLQVFPRLQIDWPASDPAPLLSWIKT